MDTGKARYARKFIIEQWWFLKFKHREDNTIEILGHWAGTIEGNDAPPPDWQNLPTFRIEEDASRFAGRVWIKDAGPDELKLTDKVYIVANPQHVFSYKER